MSGSPLKCCWINKINDSILTAVPSGFFFFQNTKFVCLYWAYSIRGWGLLGILWCCLCISNWPLICFECFVFLLSRFTLLLSKHYMKVQESILLGFKLPNQICRTIIFWELLDTQTSHEEGSRVDVDAIYTLLSKSSKIWRKCFF